MKNANKYCGNCTVKNISNRFTYCPECGEELLQGVQGEELRQEVTTTQYVVIVQIGNNKKYVGKQPKYGGESRLTHMLNRAEKFWSAKDAWNWIEQNKAKYDVPPSVGLVKRQSKLMSVFDNKEELSALLQKGKEYNG
jgi:predicted amidophosphoribosyltransferase